MTSPTSTIRNFAILTASVVCLAANTAAQTPAANAAFASYTHKVEARLAQQHRSRIGFFPSPSQTLRAGEPVLEQLTSSGAISLPGALLHDWRGTAFVPGATAVEFEQLLKDLDSYPQHFAPQVLQAKVLERQGDSMQAFMRVSQRHVITVVMDSTYDVTFGRLDAQHGYSRSKSTAISEIEGAGTRSEHALSAAQEHGFLWRQNTYWTYEERDGGLAVQIESISLTRAIPTGLGWAVRPFVESVPRDSLDFTLRAVCKALRK
jgi:hypothetical protein